VPYLTLNGVTVPVVQDGASRSTLYLGGAGERAFSGALRRSTRARKREWRFRTGPLVQSEAVAFAGLIEGAGHHWSFDVDTWSSRGLAPSAGSASIVSGGKHGAYCTPPSGVLLTYPTALGVDFSVLAWKRNAVWDNHTLIFQNDVGNGYFHGNTTPTATGLAPASGWAGISRDTSGRLRLSGESGSAFYDDVVCLPVAIPVAWVPGLFSFRGPQPFSALPALQAGGDFAPTPVAVRGELMSAEPLQVGTAVHESLEFVLREV
jgi:hypothetical protein